MPVSRLSGSARREEILAASVDLFAAHGFHGVTTRMIANAAGISEALLYRHWKSKEALFSDLQRWCIRSTMDVAERMAALEASTSTLVLGSYFLVWQIIRPLDGRERGECIKRLVLASLVEDGAFARSFLQATFVRFIPKFLECLEAADAAGDLVSRPRHPELTVWLCHHLPVMVSCFALPRNPVVDYGVGEDAVIEEATRFVLRGLGLRDEAIRRHFDPEGLARFTRGLMDPGKAARVPRLRSARPSPPTPPPPRGKR
jgi:AcrR family transcriptional regulator